VAAGVWAVPEAVAALPGGPQWAVLAVLAVAAGLAVRGRRGGYPVLLVVAAGIGVGFCLAGLATELWQRVMDTLARARPM
jgi:hypothetical protein